MEILKIKGLCKSFGEKEVLKDVDLTVNEGSVFGFIGKNGAGKTTAMKAVLGLLDVDGGEIFVAGERVRYGENSTNKLVGYLPDVPGFYPFMTAREYLQFSADVMGMERAEAKARIDELLSLVGLGDENSRINGYSRGMKQRLGIASALLGKPKLLICDEPTSALDPIGRREILGLLASLGGETTVIFSTHVLSDVERICTDFALLDGGKIVMQRPISDIKNMSFNEEFSVQTADAEGAMRLLSAFPTAKRGESCEVVFEGGDGLMKEVLTFICDTDISLVKLERLGHSLESLFVGEVLK